VPEAHFPAEDARATTAVDPFQGSRYSRTNGVNLLRTLSGDPLGVPGPRIRQPVQQRRSNYAGTNRGYDAELAALLCHGDVDNPAELTGVGGARAAWARSGQQHGALPPLSGLHLPALVRPPGCGRSGTAGSAHGEGQSAPAAPSLIREDPSTSAGPLAQLRGGVRTADRRLPGRDRPRSAG